MQKSKSNLFLVKVKRICKNGFVNFWRNGWISLATILVMIITLFTLGSIIFSKAVLGSMIAQIQDKVDVSVYLKQEADEREIAAFKNSIAKLPEIKTLEYISPEQSLQMFKERHKDNESILQSLDEIGGNPLGAVINIKTKEPSQYESVANFLKAQSDRNSDSIIYKINYFQNKKVIDRLTNILDSSKELGAIITFVLFIISVLVIFNTIHLTIHISREEIGIMRLVGASNKFVSGPFIVEGAMYGVISAVVTMVLFYGFAVWLGPKTESFLSGISLFRYYVSNFGEIFLILLSVGVVLGVVSSYIAVRRYLRV